MIVQPGVMLGAFLAVGCGVSLGQQVVINEVHYDPIATAVVPPAGNFCLPDYVCDANDLAFVELYNASDAPVNLDGWSVAGDISYTFGSGVVLDPGNYLVLARHATFLGSMLPVAPGAAVVQYSGDLGAASGTIRILDDAVPTPAVIDEVSYDATPPWPVMPAGQGPALELIHPALDNSLAVSWQPSVASNGTPGGQNSVVDGTPAVILNEYNAVGAGDFLKDGSADVFFGRVEGNGGNWFELVVTEDHADLRGWCLDWREDTALVDDMGTLTLSDDALWADLRSGTIVTFTELDTAGGGLDTDVSFDPLTDDWWVNVNSFDAQYVTTVTNVAGDGPGNFSVGNDDWQLTIRDATGTIVFGPAGEGIPDTDPGINSEEVFKLEENPSAAIDPVLANYQDGNSSSFGHPNLWSGGAMAQDFSVLRSGLPVVLLVSPPRGTVIETLPAISVTFSEVVTGVTAGDLSVNGSPALSVSGNGAGPYEFSGFVQPVEETVGVALVGGAIADSESNPFAGDAWQYVFNLPNIVVNELHYHPWEGAVDPVVDPTEDPENLQFIELYNADSAVVDLAGWQISDGIVFTFPDPTPLAPDTYLILAKNASVLQGTATIPGGVTVLQWDSGNLRNSGERVALTDHLGNLVDEVAFGDSGGWPAAADGEGPSLELKNPTLPNQYGLAWEASSAVNGTPGAANSAFESDPSPLILDPIHSPALPTSADSVTITVLVVDEAPDPTVTLYHRQDQVPAVAYASVAMLDDGAHGDGAAGDGVYGAVLAPLGDGEILDFYITAGDGVNTATLPRSHESADPACSLTGCQGDTDPTCVLCQRFLCKFSDELLPTDFAVYHIIVRQADKATQEALACCPYGACFDPCKTEFDATFIDDTGEVYYNVTERYRGQSSIDNLPRSYRVSFPAGHALDSVLGFPVRRLNLNSNNPMRLKLGMELFRDAGLPASQVEFARLRYTGINYDVASLGSFGFYGVFGVIERVDDEFLDSQGGAISPDRGLASGGNIYRGQNNGHLSWPYHEIDAWGRNGIEKVNNEEDDWWDDLTELCEALNTTPAAEYESVVSAIVDEEQWATWFALHNLVGNKEGGIYRDSGDDYFIYLNPPGHPDGYNAQFLPWDLDSIVTGGHESIWRTSSVGVVTFVRSNAFGPIYVQKLRELMDGIYSQSSMNAKIDAMPDAVFAGSGGDSKLGIKSWIAAQLASFENQITDALTLNLPASPYTDSNPLITLTGTVNMAGTHALRVNGVPNEFAIYPDGTWSRDYTLRRGSNVFVVQAFGRDGQETERITQTLVYDPPPSAIRLTMPTRMVHDKTLTLKAELLDVSGEIDWRIWNALGTVYAERVADGTPVPTSITVFETYPAGAGAGTPPADSIRFYNGVGSVSITLDDGAAVPAGDLEVFVEYDGVTVSTLVTVLENVPELFKELSGTLAGTDLTWSPGDGVIHLVGNCTVPAGSTLTIEPGTLVMVDPGALANGTRINVAGTVDAQGTASNPIFFFPTAGAAAMELPQTTHNNPSSWYGIAHTGNGTSTYRHVFVTGAGNGTVEGHPRPAIFRFANAHSLVMSDCVLVDCPGKAQQGSGNGNYQIRKSLFSRVGIGGEWNVSGHTLLVEDSWFTRIGRALESSEVDGDIFHLDQWPTSQTVRRCVLTDCGDDMVDHSNGAQPLIENCIIYDADDKTISLDGSDGATITMSNCLVFTNPNGLRCAGRPAFLNHCTISGNTPVSNPGAGSVVEESIIWPRQYNTCTGTVNHTLVGTGSNLGCGTGNFSLDPLFVDTANCNYSLRPDSPAIAASATGERIGWLGFPTAETCINDADCVDDSLCTTDSCQDGVCVYVGVDCTLLDDDCTEGGCNEVTGECVAQPVNEGMTCDDGLFCTVGETCSGGVCGGADDRDCVAYTDQCNAGVCNEATDSCAAVPVNEGGTCDDGLGCTDNDQCSLGDCVGLDTCPVGQLCDPIHGVCVFEPETITFQQGQDGYVGCRDTFIQEASPDNNNSGLDNWEWDGEDGSPAGQNIGMIRFDDLFGPGAIPLGATIDDARLTIVVFDPSVDPPGSVYLSLADWDDATVTWNNFGGEVGVQPDELGALVGSAPISNGTFELDVTATVQAWANNPAENRGWIFVANANVANGVQVHSSEYGTEAERPLLTVSYLGAVPCDDDGDCLDGLFCNGAESCNLATQQCEPGTDPCPGQHCDWGTQTCVDCLIDVDCDDGNVCNGMELCVGGACQPNSSLDCDDFIGCTIDTCDPVAGCQYADDCPAGEYCDLGTGSCETGLAPGSVIISGFSAHPEPEWIELFNTTNLPIALDTLMLTTRLDIGTGDGAVEEEWTLGASPAGRTILPHSFFLVGESGVSPAPDLAATLDLATGEGGTAERAISLELVIDGYHMDYVLYGRHDGSTPAGAVPPGDIPFDGVSWPRTEVVRTVTGTLPIASFNEGPTLRLSAEDLYRGHDVLGFYKDESSLPDTFPAGVWTSAHSTANSGTPRNSSTAPVLPPAGCTDDLDCSDGNPCTDDICDTDTGECTNPIDDTNTCSDDIDCTDDLCSGGACVGVDNCPTGQACNETTGLCENLAPDAPAASSLGGRYLSITPPPGLPSVALQVASADIPCLPRYVDDSGYLVDTPVFHSSTEWGTVSVGDEEITPLTEYEVRADARLDAEPENLSDPTVITTWLWGDANGDAASNVADILCVLDGFQDLFANCTLEADDLHGEVPNREINVADILAVLDGFQSLPYPDADPCSQRSVVTAFPTGEGLIFLTPRRAIVYPGEELEVDAWVVGNAQVRGYQVTATAEIVSGPGNVEIACPDGVFIAENHPRNLFVDSADTYPVTACNADKAASSLLSGAVPLDGDAKYLATFVLALSPGVSEATTISLTLEPAPASLLRDAMNRAIPLAVGEPVYITPGECILAGSSDSDFDGDVDLEDLMGFTACTAGSEAILGDCCVFDADADGDIDLADFGALQRQFTGH